ncbi:hypothetical protein [Chryseobacterium mucoviscidosis]|uniref:hypothetical protein n=1 Tax=Chryseobacterium mucoviscidosis TaxID=1945581 RepID=UPI003015EB1C
MKAAKPVEKDNKNHHSQSKKQKAKKPVVVPLPVAEVAPLQTQKPEESAALAGFATPNIKKTNANGIIAPVHGSQTIYDQGSGIMFKKHQESMAETGDINHPDTQKAEKDYISTLNISQVKDYHDLKSGTYVPKTLQEQAAAYQNAKSEAESKETIPEFISQSGGGDEDRVTHKGDIYTLHFHKYKKDEFGRIIDTNEKLDRYAERMIFGQEVNHNWTPKFTDAQVQALISNGTGITYRKSDYKGAEGGEGTGNGKKSSEEAGKENSLKPNQGKTLEELKSEMAKLPDEIKKLIGVGESNLKLADYQRLLAIAEELKQLSPQDIAVFQHLNLKATDNIELFEKTVDVFLAKKEQLKALIEQTPTANTPKSMQEAVEGSWQGFDDGKIGKISESDQYDLAREQTDKATLAQLQYMKDHPGEVAKDFAKSAMLLNTPETAEAIKKDLQEAANGDVNAWQRLAAGLGAGAKVSGWLLAVVCIAAVISMFTGVGELALLIDVLLVTTIALSVAESEARIKAASQAKDATTFKENVNQAAAARANAIVAVAMLGLAKAVSFIAKTFFPKTLAKIGESVKNFRARLREKMGLDNFAALKSGFLGELETNKQSLLQSGEQAKQTAAQTANELAQMDTQTFTEKLDQARDDFYSQATTQNGQTTNWKAISQTPEGLKGIETYKANLLQELRTEVPKHIDALVQEQVQAVSKLQEGIKLSENAEACDAVLQEYEKFSSPEEVAKRAYEKQIEITKNLSEKALQEINENLKKNDTKRAHKKLAEIIKNLSEKKATQEINESLKKNDTFEENPRKVEEKVEDSKNTEEKTQKYILANEKAKELITNAELERELVQRDLLNLAKESGGKMEGLDFAIKGEESLTRKIYDRTQDRHIEKIGVEKAISKVSSKMNDVLRFTITFEPKVYVENYLKIVKELEARGYKKTKTFNAWFQGDGSYKGLNATFETPSGQQFELQFHTEETFRIKSETHDLYEASRAADATEELKAINNAKQKAAYENIEIPENINLLEKNLQGIEGSLKEKNTKFVNAKLAEIIKNLSEKKASQEINESLKKNDLLKDIKYNPREDARFDVLAKEEGKNSLGDIAKAQNEAEAILLAEYEKYIQNPRRPNVKNGDPDLDFKVDGPPPYKYADVKTPVNRGDLEVQAIHIGKKITTQKGGADDVAHIVDLKNIPTDQKAIFVKNVINGANSSKGIIFINK